MTDPYDTEEAALQALDRYLATKVDLRLLPSLQSYWASLLEPGSDFENRYDPQTCNLYDTALANAIHGTELGKLRIDQVRRIHVQRRIDQMYRKYKESTVRRYGSCISVVFEHAALSGLLSDRVEGGQFIPANPCKSVKFRAIPATSAYILSDAELIDLPEQLYAFNQRLSAMVTVLADTGVRPGELCAMDASKIKDGVWLIDDMRGRSGELRHRTKSNRFRHVALSDDALVAIALHGARKGPVWLNENDKPVRPDALSLHLRRFRAYLQKKIDEASAREGSEPPKVPPLTPRNLRKTFITRAVEAGDVKSAQITAGHASSRMTLDVYAQGRKDAQLALIEKLSSTIKRPLWEQRGTDRGTEDVTASRAEPA